MKKYIFLLISFTILISSCSRKNTQEMNAGKWVGVLILDDKNPENKLPFNFSYTKNNKEEIVITNAGERIIIQEITFTGDSVFIKLPVFKDEIRAKIVTSDVLQGTYLHFGSKSKYSFPFSAALGSSERFAGANKTPAFDVSGRWETIVQPGDSDQYTIIGEFNQIGNNLTGTFLTTSGDYRFLEGAVSGNDFMLSCLDGAHSLLFKATLSEKGTLENGILIGGPSWKEKWRAVKNDKIELPNPEKQSMLKENIEKIDFSFLDLTGKKVSLSDDKYKDKVIILQIMGSWCPNCMDETRFFTEIYDNYKPKGLEIIGLCYESKDYDESKQRIERFVKQLNAKYDFLYAGEVGKNSLMQSLPFLKDFKGYPTTIYLDRNHKAKKIFTGFSGPGTGKYYEKQKSKILLYIDELLSGK